MGDEIEEQDQYDHLFKIVVIGDSGVGKSNLISRYTTNIFREEARTTIGVEFGHKTIKIEEKVIKAQIWDTAGQERFKALTRGYYRGAVGGLLVYSVTDKASFEHLEKWLEELTGHAEPGILVMLVGNKSDLQSARQVSTQEGKDFAAKNGLSFIETSAKTGAQVDSAFAKIIQEIYKAQTAKLQVKKDSAVAEPAKPKEGNVIKLKPEDEPADGTDGANKPAPRRGCC
eukprot:TRINITY_DN14441_c0_g1_i1.p1 TRINITY_DN14441_c0_g1~~TRINITY_DN14441_c0_g1_i1.p1  ORF type:complete len:241 (-),score=80.49 TRINITY_DN14441_c0_g1_i1:92-778(-)